MGEHLIDPVAESNHYTDADHRNSSYFNLALLLCSFREK